MSKLVRLLCLLFICSVVLGTSATGFAGDTGRPFTFGGNGGENGQSGLDAAGCSGYCYPGASDCFSSCYCEGSLSCCVGGCDWCCSQIEM